MNIDFILAKLESQISNINPIIGRETETCTGEMSAETMKDRCLKEITNLRFSLTQDIRANKTLTKAVCINEISELSDKIRRGFEYCIDRENAWSDEDGTWFTPVYDLDGCFIANNIKMSHFATNPLRSHVEGMG